ncbi:MAG TPA: acyl-CoA dehydrogenase family protein [Actinomycetota bacterium]|nr:acyl-CoA dehydrogenase family protein [Actinomycetota bacterium]
MTSQPFELSEDQEEFRRVVRAFAEEAVAPRAAEIDATDEYPWDIHKVMVDEGLLAVGYPEEFGGAGGGPVDVCLMVEEISRVSAGVSLIPLVNRLGAIPILLGGSGKQRQEAVEGIASGEHQYSYCLTEPASGSDAAAMTSRAVSGESGSWVLNGRKRFISNAGISDRYVYFAVTDPAGEKGRNITAFLLPGDAPGFSLGRAEKKMGIRGSPTREVICEDVAVADDQLVGKVNEGFQIALQTLDYSRPTVAAQAVGIAQGALDQATAYVAQREQFGKPIAEFQGVRFMLADMATATEAARLLTYRAAAMAEARDPRTGRIAAMAKLFASDAAMRVTTDAVQLLGGYGYIKDFPVERMMRDAKITQIYEGTNQIQRVVIARSLLRSGGRG